MTGAFPREVLVNCLLPAKRHTYASQGDEAAVAPLLPGTKQLESRDGLFFSRDMYVGMAYFDTDDKTCPVGRHGVEERFGGGLQLPMEPDLPAWFKTQRSMVRACKSIPQ